MRPSHYAVLGLPRNFDPEQLKKQYRLLALRYHPDRNRGHEAKAAEKFKTIREAYLVLRDPEQRLGGEQRDGAARARRCERTCLHGV